MDNKPPLGWNWKYADQKPQGEHEWVDDHTWIEVDDKGEIWMKSKDYAAKKVEKDNEETSLPELSENRVKKVKRAADIAVKRANEKAKFKR